MIKVEGKKQQEKDKIDIDIEKYCVHFFISFQFSPSSPRIQENKDSCPLNSSSPSPLVPFLFMYAEYKACVKFEIKEKKGRERN